jgi:hypothetical protein
MPAPDFTGRRAIQGFVEDCFYFHFRS